MPARNRTASDQFDAENSPNLPQNAKGQVWTVLSRIAPYLWPKDNAWAKKRVVIALACLFLAKLATVYSPILNKYAVDTLSGQGTDLFLGAFGLVIAYGLARLSSNGFQQLRDAVFARVGAQAMTSLAMETFRHIHNLSLRYHISRKTGGLSRIIERGIQGLAYILRYLIFSIVPLGFELALVLIMLWRFFDWRYVLVIFCVIGVYSYFTFAVTQWRVKLRREMNRRDTDANQKSIDSLLNFETVKYFGAEKREAERFGISRLGYEDASVKSTTSLALLNFGQSAIITGGLVAVMSMAAKGVQAGTLTVGDFVMVNAFMIQITLPLNFLGSVYRDIRQGVEDMGEMFHLLDQPQEVQDKADALDLNVSGGAITLENVAFGYDQDRQILKGVSLTIGAGEKVALVGATGSGKSTIGRLLFRFYDVWSGSIRIDSQDLRDVTQDSLHAAIGVVPQDTVLFNDTIRYNIAYGREGATDADVVAAAEAAQIHDFITSLPEGYETQVGERGLKLSGGEKQRVGIARTLLKDPPILLLDEATSALDTRTEVSIQDALARAGQGRTVVTIAHRLSTISDSDKIVVLEAGEVLEQGTHTELLKAGGRYADLWSRQQQDG